MLLLLNETWLFIPMKVKTTRKSMMMIWISQLKHAAFKVLFLSELFLSGGKKEKMNYLHSKSSTSASRSMRLMYLVISMMVVTLKHGSK